MANVNMKAEPSQSSESMNIVIPIGTVINTYKYFPQEAAWAIKYNEKLGRHLMSPDFFSAAVHETSKFEIDRVVHQGKDRYKVEGNMTIKGITNRNKFIANIKVSKDKIEAFADIVIDRAEYDVRYGSGSFIEDLGDKTIYDEFSLKVTLLADKK